MMDAIAKASKCHTCSTFSSSLGDVCDSSMVCTRAAVPLSAEQAGVTTVKDFTSALAVQVQYVLLYTAQRSAVSMA